MDDQLKYELDHVARAFTITGKYPQPLPRVGSAVLVEDQGRVLLGIRQKDPGRGDLVIPGGGVEPFETLEQAAIREIKDETGLDIELTGRIGTYELINPENKTHKVIVYSKAKVVGGYLNAQSDISDVQFFSREDLKRTALSDLISSVLRDAGWLD